MKFKKNLRAWQIAIEQARVLQNQQNPMNPNQQVPPYLMDVLQNSNFTSSQFHLTQPFLIMLIFSKIRIMDIPCTTEALTVDNIHRELFTLHKAQSQSFTSMILIIEEDTEVQTLLMARWPVQHWLRRLFGLFGSRFIGVSLQSIIYRSKLAYLT